MHGLGNDYVYVNGFDQKVEDPAAVARRRKVEPDEPSLLKFSAVVL